MEDSPCGGGRLVEIAAHADKLGALAGENDRDSAKSLFERLIHRSPYMASPPSTASTCPVMYAAAFEARKTAASATSSGSPKRPCGIWPRICSLTLSGRPLVSSVFTNPGAIALTVTLRVAASRAVVLV